MPVKKAPFIRVSLMASLLFMLGACGGEGEPEQPPTNATAAESTPSPDLAELLAGESRSAADRERDTGRKPAEVIEFLGIEPGMTVIDVIAAGGWYTEALSLAVGPGGRVVSQNPPAVLQMRDGANEKALSARLADDRLPNVSRLDKGIAEVTLEDGPFDAALTALNLHDILHRNGEDAALGAMRSVFSILKPGGVFGVIDHEGNEGQDNAAVHRMLKADAVRLAEAAGFVVEGDSGILHVHGDDRTQHVFAEGVRGKTHRFLLKLRKPK
jgi:predicted methyltransferase